MSLKWVPFEQMKCPSVVYEEIRSIVFQDSIFTARKRSLGQGNIFSNVCQEFCPPGGGGEEGGGLLQCMLGCRMLNCYWTNHHSYM